MTNAVQLNRKKVMEIEIRIREKTAREEQEIEGERDERGKRWG